MKENVINCVKKSLAQTLQISSLDSIHLKSRLKDDLGLDSMSSLTFLMALEESIDGFVVNPDTLQSDHLVDVESIVNYIIQEIIQNATDVDYCDEIDATSSSLREIIYA